jgi:SAM-dependent methyltransferase
MGDLNQRLYVEARAARFAPPYLEVGSHDHGSSQQLRELFAPRGDWLGVDLQPGPGVDLALDLAAPFEAVDAALAGRRFGTVFCLSVLEHCRQPFEMAANLTRLLASGGHVCVGVPFAWKFHGYPSDYWRFTHEGVKQLFPGLAFAAEDTVLATERDRHTLPVDAEMGRIPFSFGSWRRRGRPVRGLAAGTLRAMARLGLLRWLAGHRYVLAPTPLLMTGMLRG